MLEPFRRAGRAPATVARRGDLPFLPHGASWPRWIEAKALKQPAGGHAPNAVPSCSATDPATPAGPWDLNTTWNSAPRTLRSP
jgi:hypothetical protein